MRFDINNAEKVITILEFVVHLRSALVKTGALAETGESKVSSS